MNDLLTKAGDERTCPTALRLLACSYSTEVLAVLAANPATPHDALDRLARNASPVVRMGVAHNPTTELGTLFYLCRDVDDEVQSYAYDALHARPVSEVLTFFGLEDLSVVDLPRKWVEEVITEHIGDM